MFPEAFRAGALGPDFYPDILIGQMYIHPYDEEAEVGSGEWLRLLIESVNRLPQWNVRRLEALSFTLGYMLHYCGDMFGHDFVNTFSGGTFPSLWDVNIANSKDPELNNILSHMSIESFMDTMMNDTFWANEGQLAIKAPARFVTESLLLNGNISAGIADIYKDFEPAETDAEDKDVAEILSGVPIYLDILVSWRNKVMKVADKFRPETEVFQMGISSYADQWVLDIERATYGLVETFDMIAHRVVTGEKNPAIDEETLHDWIFNGYPIKEILKDRLDLDKINKEDGTVNIILEELSFWWDSYALQALGIPDVFVNPPWPEWTEYISLVFTWPMDIFMAAVKTALSYIFAEIIIAAVGSEINLLIGQLEAFQERLTYPPEQLDHKDNPYDPTGDKTNYSELEEYMMKYFYEQSLLNGQTVDSLLNDTSGTHVLDRLVDSDFEAFYNTMVMFKLILMGPQNFDDLLYQNGITSQTAYVTNTAELETTRIRLDVKTADHQYSGTDDNVWAIVCKLDKNGNIDYSNPITSKLLDNSINDDLECGDTNTFYIDLPYPVKLDEFDIVIIQKGTATTNGGWACESIEVTPMHAGINLTTPIGVGGNLHMDAGVTWNLDFQTALSYHRTGGMMHAQMPVTHVKLRIKTGDGSYASGTDQDVKLLAFVVSDSTEPGVTHFDHLVEVDLDEYLYNDFEDGDDDEYILPLGMWSSKNKRNTYPTLGDMTLLLTQNSDYDWYVNNVTVTPYCGTMQLTHPMDFGSHWIKESDEFIDLSPSNKIDDGTISYFGYGPLKLTYETALDDGLLEDMQSLDAGVQWEFLPVLWDTAEGRKLFFKLFKGFEPEIECLSPTVTEEEGADVLVSFSGVWNGVGEKRRNALAEYAKKTLGQDTYQEMPPVEGYAKITLIECSSGKEYYTGYMKITDSGQVAAAFMLQSGYYDIKISYIADPNNPMYADTDVVFPKALHVLGAEFTEQTPAFVADSDDYRTCTIEVDPSNVTFSFNSNALSLEEKKAGYNIKRSFLVYDSTAEKTLHIVQADWGEEPLSYTLNAKYGSEYIVQENVYLMKDNYDQPLDSATRVFNVKVAKPAFTTEPKGGTVGSSGKRIVMWETNFTPVKTEVRVMNLYTNSYTTATLSNPAQNMVWLTPNTSITQKYMIVVYFGTGAKDFINSSYLTISEFAEKVLVGGSVSGVESSTKTTVELWEKGRHSPTHTTTVTGNGSFYFNDVATGDWIIKAYTDVDGYLKYSKEIKVTADTSHNIAISKGYTVSGTVTSYGDSDGVVTIRALDKNEIEVAKVTTTNGTYSLGLPVGSYTIEVSKANHVTRRYSIKVGN